VKLTNPCPRLPAGAALAVAVFAVAASAVAVFVAAARAAAADLPPTVAPRDRLRFIVQEQCVPHWRAAHDPAPCVRLSAGADGQAEQGYAVLPDRKGGAHFLLIPTQTVRGVESPEARAPGALNYFDAAWQAREALAGVVGRGVPRTAVGLATNQIGARSQDQLHIHISCLRESVAHALAAESERIGPQWSAIDLGGWHYQAMRLMGESPGPANPIELLADQLPGGRAAMEQYTLLLAGMDFRQGPGFVLLAGRGVPGSELLLDPACALAARGVTQLSPGTN
jgi:CDP-diacylglycerol pyrophosphatase